MADKPPMTWKSFFETFPLYKKWKTPAELPSSEWPISLPATWANMPKPTLTMLCHGEPHRSHGDAHKTRTFKMADAWGDATDSSNTVFNRVVGVSYACADCGQALTFLIEFGPAQETTILPAPARAVMMPDGKVVSRAAPPVRSLTSPTLPAAPPPQPAKVQAAAWVRKVGQCPQWWPEIDKEERRAFEAIGAGCSDTYRKGLSGEGVGFGVGAFAYYRAIVERIIESLKESKVEGLDERGKKEFEEAWQRAERDGSKRIEMVYSMLPEELRVDGANPLDYLYTRLSAGLHGGDDALCMEEAEELREALLDLVMGLERERERKATADRMRALQEKLTKKTT